MDANPWRRLGPVVERAVREIDLALPEDQRRAAELTQTDLLELLHAVVEALGHPSM
jgi:hypothetical protein